MATAPVQNAPVASPSETIEQRFRRLKAIWEAETMFLSDTHKIMEHPAVKEIIQMGDAVVPLMLRDIEKEPQHWVRALPGIAGANPVSPSDGGNIRKMGEAWLRWVREHGYQR